jgi:hypothetical protein
VTENKRKEQHDIPFTDDWYDKHREQFGMLSRAIEMGVLSAGYKLITAFGGMLIIIAVVYKALGIG